VTTASVTLRPISATEFAGWRDHAATSFAAGGDNPTAIHLYDALGYTVTSQQMRKQL
jgi:ribosomal protein S18 acetylase RimI-like enzyme